MRRRDEGFTLVELMVVVVILGILLAIGFPAFLGARVRASDRAAQTSVRTANTTAVVFYSDHQEFTDDPTLLQAVDTSIDFTSTLTTTSAKRLFVAVPPSGTFMPLDTVYLAAKSAGGACYWMRTVGNDITRYAKNDCSAQPADAEFVESW
jgi:type IV pilus assembly protein PilA